MISSYSPSSSNYKCCFKLWIPNVWTCEEKFEYHYQGIKLFNSVVSILFRMSYTCGMSKLPHMKKSQSTTTKVQKLLNYVGNSLRSPDACGMPKAALHVEKSEYHYKGIKVTKFCRHFPQKPWPMWNTKGCLTWTEVWVPLQKYKIYLILWRFPVRKFGVSLQRYQISQLWGTALRTSDQFGMLKTGLHKGKC